MQPNQVTLIVIENPIKLLKILILEQRRQEAVIKALFYYFKVGPFPASSSFMFVFSLQLIANSIFR